MLSEFVFISFQFRSNNIFIIYFAVQSLHTTWCPSLHYFTHRAWHSTHGNSHFTQQALQSTHPIYTLHLVLHTLHTAIYTLHTVLHTLHNAIHTLHTAIHILHTPFSTLHAALYALHWTLHNLFWLFNISKVKATIVAFKTQKILIF